MLFRSGIGIDLAQTKEDFGPELSPIATSLAQHMAVPPTQPETAQALLTELEQLWLAFPTAQAEYLTEYRRRCGLIGRAVNFRRQGKMVQGEALAVNDDFSLQVRLPGGGETALTAGEVSVRL